MRSRLSQALRTLINAREAGFEPEVSKFYSPLMQVVVMAPKKKDKNDPDDRMTHNLKFQKSQGFADPTRIGGFDGHFKAFWLALDDKRHPTRKLFETQFRELASDPAAARQNVMINYWYFGGLDVFKDAQRDQQEAAEKKFIAEHPDTPTFVFDRGENKYFFKTVQSLQVGRETVQSLERLSRTGTYSEPVHIQNRYVEEVMARLDEEEQRKISAAEKRRRALEKEADREEQREREYQREKKIFDRKNQEQCERLLRGEPYEEI